MNVRLAVPARRESCLAAQRLIPCSWRLTSPCDVFHWVDIAFKEVSQEIHKDNWGGSRKGAKVVVTHAENLRGA